MCSAAKTERTPHATLFLSSTDSSFSSTCQTPSRRTLKRFLCSSWNSYRMIVALASHLFLSCLNFFFQIFSLAEIFHFFVAYPVNLTVCIYLFSKIDLLYSFLVFMSVDSDLKIWLFCAVSGVSWMAFGISTNPSFASVWPGLTWSNCNRWGLLGDKKGLLQADCELTAVCWQRIH